MSPQPHSALDWVNVALQEWAQALQARDQAIRRIQAAAALCDYLMGEAERLQVPKECWENAQLGVDSPEA